MVRTDLNLKKLLIVSIITLISLLLISCNSIAEKQERKEVTINLPQDSTINGYRTEANVNDNSNTVSADKVGLESNKATSSPKTENSTDSKRIKYFANINSKTFHKSDCSSAKNLKEENRYITSDREELLANGYTPCKKCNP